MGDKADKPVIQDHESEKKPIADTTEDFSDEAPVTKKDAGTVKDVKPGASADPE